MLSKQEIEEIITKVQKDYPQNSRQALDYAITLTLLKENDWWVKKLRNSKQDRKRSKIE